MTHLSQRFAVQRRHRSQRRPDSAKIIKIHIETMMIMSNSSASGAEEKILNPPAHFGTICPNVYRSSEPNLSNIGYFKTLGLKTIVFLSAESLSKPFKQFIDHSSIKLVCFCGLFNCSRFICSILSLLSDSPTDRSIWE
jgi:protein tyrosine/serine phosphatase